MTDARRAMMAGPREFYVDDSVTIYNADCREVLPHLSDIALSVWSPPYFVGKDYEAYLDYPAWKALLAESLALHFAALKPGGFVAVNVADILCFPDESMPRMRAESVGRQKGVTKEAVAAARAAHPEMSRKELAGLLGCSEQTVDRRLNGNGVRGGKYEPQTRVHLTGHLLEDAGYQSGLYLYDRRVWVKDPAWANSKWHHDSYRSVDEFEYIYIFWKPGPTVVDKARLDAHEWREWGARGVWSFRSVRANVGHEAMFPVGLPRRLIRMLTAPGDIVLDPFMGSGTTLRAAKDLGRRSIGIDINETYCRIASRGLGQEALAL